MLSLGEMNNKTGDAKNNKPENNLLQQQPVLSPEMSTPDSRKKIRPEGQVSPEFIPQKHH